jgi:hypothetical protein
LFNYLELEDVSTWFIVFVKFDSRSFVGVVVVLEGM